MTDDSAARLNELADAVATEFKEQRRPEEFKQISIVIDTSTHDRPTLIVHTEGEDASELADQVERFLRDRNAHTNREFYSKTDIRVLATLG